MMSKMIYDTDRYRIVGLDSVDSDVVHKSMVEM